MFGNSLLGAFDNDPFFAGHQQQMRQMNEMMQSPFGSFGMMSPFGNPAQAMNQPLAVTDSRGRQRDMAMRGERSREMMPRADPMDPFGMNSVFGGMGSMFSNMNNMMANMQQQMSSAMQNPGGGQMFSQSSVMTYSNTGQGPPKIYQATSSKQQGPGGVVQTRKSVRDSEAAMEKMSVGRYIGDRGHVQEKVRHTNTGDMEENEEYLNQGEEDLPTFNHEWHDKTQRFQQPHNRMARMDHRPRHRALTDGRHRREEKEDEENAAGGRREAYRDPTRRSRKAKAPQRL